MQQQEDFMQTLYSTDCLAAWAT